MPPQEPQYLLVDSNENTLGAAYINDNDELVLYHDASGNEVFLTNAGLEDSGGDTFITGVSIENNGTAVIDATGVDFGTDLDVTDNGDGTVTVDANSGDTTTTNSFPNPPSPEMVNIPGVNLADGTTHGHTITLPAGYRLSVYALGAQDDTNSAPSGLTAEVFDVTNSRTVISKNQKLFTETLAAGYHGDESTSYDIELRINNNTGGSVNTTGQFEVELAQTRLDPYSGNPIWQEADYSWSTSAPDNPAILRDPKTGVAKQYDGTYWMGYDDTTDAALATSSDLLSWSASGDGSVYTGRFTDLLDMRDYDTATHNFYSFDGTGSNVVLRKSDDMATWTSGTNIGSNLNSPEDFRLQEGSDGVWYAVYEQDGQTSGVAVRTAELSATLPESEFSDQGPAVESAHGFQFVANPAIMRRDMGDGTYYEVYYEGRGQLPPDIITVGAWVKEQDIHTPSEWEIWGTEALAESGTDDSIRPNSMIAVGNETWCYHTGNNSSNKAFFLYQGESLLQ